MDFSTFVNFFGNPGETERKIHRVAKELCGSWNDNNSTPCRAGHRQPIEESIIIAQVKPPGRSDARSIQVLVLSSTKFTDEVQTREEKIRIERRNLEVFVRFRSNCYSDERVRRLDEEGLAQDGWNLRLPYNVRTTLSFLSLFGFSLLVREGEPIRNEIPSSLNNFSFLFFPF